MTGVLHRLLHETRALLAATPGQAETARNIASLHLDPPVPRDLPATRHLAGIASDAPERTRPLTDAILAAAPQVAWQQSYSADQLGQRFTDGYAWFNLAGPSGPFVARHLRLAFGFWAQGLDYPTHSHAPDETYVILAGGARFTVGDAPPSDATPGDTVHVPSGTPHALDMSQSPLLVLGVWTGTALDTPPRLDDAA